MTQESNWKKNFSKWMMTTVINYWGPFLGAGIRVKSTSKDFTSIKVELRQTPFNRNIVGVHFGGSLYAMCDPFYMGILIHHLGMKDFIVWDKAASIKFLKPGKGKVHATFTITLDQIADIKSRAIKNGKVEETFTTHVYDKNGNAVAEVQKLLYVRHKTNQ